MSDILDILDSSGNIIGRATRADVYAQKLPHRIVHIFIINRQTGKVFLQQRAWDDDFMPGAYCTSAGGHVDAGENWLDAAMREVKEELEIEVALELISKFIYNRQNDIDNFDRFIHLFVGYVDEDFTVNNKEVIGGKFLNLDEALDLVSTGKEHPQLEPCLRELKKIINDK